MELLDVYNEKGKTTGKIVERGTKDESFLPGEHIAIAQIYIENDKGEFFFDTGVLDVDGDVSFYAQYTGVGTKIMYDEDSFHGEKYNELKERIEELEDENTELQEEIDDLR